MGVSMCSQASTSERSNVHEFQYAETLHTSEQDDTDDDSEIFNLGRISKCLSLPGLSDLDKPATMNRAKSEQVLRSSGYSYQKKMKDRRRSSVVNQEAELQAKRYSKIVMDDTLKHLSHTIRTASSIVEIGDGINNELARQERVLSKAETDISIAEYETDQMTQTLKGMRSLRGKLKNVIWKKEPKLKIKDFDCERSTFSNLDLLKEDVGLSSFSRMECKPSSTYKATSEDMHQTQINAGMGQLHKALDIMKVQQVEAAWALDSHERRLSMFENQVTTTNNKINCQSRMIGSLMGKP